MKFFKNLKLIFFFISFLSLYSCNDNDQNPSSVDALNKIASYAENSENPEPTLQDYINIGIDANLLETVDYLNLEVDSLERESVDSTEEIKAIALLTSNNEPLAQDDISSVLLEVTDSDLTEYSPEELEVEIPLIATDDDADALTYSIVDEPKHGTAILVNDVVQYTPNTNYLGADSFTFKANDGIEDSNIAEVSFTVISLAESANYPCFASRTSGSLASKCDNEDLTKIKSHLIWFNGTSEDRKHNKHLFDGLNDKNHTIIKGWGIRPFWAGYSWYSPKKSHIVGIENTTAILNKIDNYIKATLAGDLDRIRNSDTLMIGGFSRGAAFFVPYFLKKIDDFVPGISATTHAGSKKTIYIYLMDPVNGSENESDKTITTLKKLDIYSKDTLVNTLKGKGYSLKLIYLSAGFDKRQKNFILDTTFHDKKDQFDYFYSARIGLTHANMSIWSADNDYTTTVKNSIEYGPYSPGSRDNIANVSSDNAVLQAQLLSLKPDLDVTKEIFSTYLNDRSKAEALETTIEKYHNKTDELLGSGAAKKGYGVSYKTSGWLKVLYALTGNATYQIDGSSRLVVQKRGEINELFK